MNRMTMIEALEKLCKAQDEVEKLYDGAAGKSLPCEVVNVYFAINDLLAVLGLDREALERGQY